MPSRHSTLAPQQTADTHEAAAERRAPRSFAKSLATRPRLKPKRDALTRVRHDLRSLVHSVVGYSDLLNQPHYGALTTEQARFVGHVRSAAEHLQELVDTCIELSRPDNDQFTLELPEAPLGQVLRRIRNSLMTRGVLCELSLASNLERHAMVVDMPQLERALVNLALVLSKDGATANNTLTAALDDAVLTISLQAGDAPASLACTAALEQLEDELGNRDFVRLKLAEVLLSRSSAALRLSATLDAAVVRFE